MKRPLKTVNRIVQAFKKERRVKDAPHRRRPRATTADEDRALIAAVVVRPQTTVREALRELGIKACETTAKRRLAEAALRKRVACRKPLIRKTNQTKRLQFARDHENWTTSDWENVVFTDESSFTTRWDQRQRVWRPENTDDLWGAIKEEWERLRSDSSLTAALYNSLPSRMAAVVAANGDATRY
ncbi:hypothetical protein HPB50_022817 [Hyalomma asiaticum]|uniref:Uncharacterized protein n=1 Tax=Hyalomma asiaticum TaxID=266040 RepID=A0ACB7TKK7_HYAAI|nr:hypothetical protein HPB50_022817 [Hyalomma asiaticum]